MAERLLPQLNSLVDACRRLRVPIIFTQVFFLSSVLFFSLILFFLCFIFTQVRAAVSVLVGVACMMKSLAGAGREDACMPSTAVLCCGRHSPSVCVVLFPSVCSTDTQTPPPRSAAACWCGGGAPTAAYGAQLHALHHALARLPAGCHWQARGRQARARACCLRWLPPRGLSQLGCRLGSHAWQLLPELRRQLGDHVIRSKRTYDAFQVGWAAERACHVYETRFALVCAHAWGAWRVHAGARCRACMAAWPACLGFDVQVVKV